MTILQANGMETSDSLVIVGVFLLGAVSAFVYANLVYTPEIIEANAELRLENRQFQIEQLVAVVEENLEECEDENDEKDAIEKLRKPLEAALNSTLEDYVKQVTDDVVADLDDDDDSVRKFSGADTQLASMLSPFVSNLRR